MAKELIKKVINIVFGPIMCMIVIGNSLMMYFNKSSMIADSDALRFGIINLAAASLSMVTFFEPFKILSKYSIGPYSRELKEAITDDISLRFAVVAALMVAFGGVLGTNTIVLRNYGEPISHGAVETASIVSMFFGSLMLLMFSGLAYILIKGSW